MLRTKGGFSHVRGYNSRESSSRWTWDLPRWSWASPSRPHWQRLTEAEEGTFANQRQPLTSGGNREDIQPHEDDRWWVRLYGIILVNVLYKPAQILIWLVMPLAQFFRELFTSIILALRHFALLTIRALTPGPEWRAFLIFITLFLWMVAGIPCLISTGVL
nr:uncharacterized protein CTRU02_15170 [Colletotrichum truncatum]KAF6781387.1 hypothetical protein CTRU02_15170 [Colletotrichum truncatum]